MAPGAKRKSLDHALASFAAPANGTRQDLLMFRKAFRKMTTIRVDGYLGAAAQLSREEDEVRMIARVKWRRGRGEDVARRCRAGGGGGGGAWRATPPSRRSERVRGLELRNQRDQRRRGQFCIFLGIQTELRK